MTMDLLRNEYHSWNFNVHELQTVSMFHPNLGAPGLSIIYEEYEIAISLHQVKISLDLSVLFERFARLN